MLSDGTKAKEVDDTVGTFDIAEILERAVFGTPEAAPTEVEQELEEVAIAATEDQLVEVEPAEVENETLSKENVNERA